MVDNNYNNGYNVTVTNCNNFVTIGKFVTQIGGNIMIKPSKKWLAVCLSASMLISTICTYVSEAKETVYNDSNVSITSAIDRYIALNGGMVEEVEATTESVATPVDAKAAMPSDAMKKESDEETETEEVAITVDENIFDGKALVVTETYVNIRESSDTSSTIVATISNNGLVTLEEKGDEWSLISSGSCKGYIKNEFLLFEDDAKAYAEANLTKVVEIATASLRVRTEGSEESEVITSVSQGTKYDILEAGAEWTKIQVDSSTSGYVKNDYIVITYNTVYAVAAQTTTDTSTDTSTESTTESTTSAPTDVPTSATGDAVAAYAVQFVGNPYVYGGTSLTEGADCSGFAMTVYADFGYSIPRTADVQATAGTEVSLDALYPGDLVFYDHGTGSINHVAIYIGNGQVVHASTSSTGIIISDINYNTPCKAVRIIY